MLFSSLLFLCFFFPAVMLLHRVLPARLRNLFLLLASVFFYAWGEIRYVPLIAALALSNWLLGMVMDHSRAGRRRFWLVIALGVDLGALCFYKYADFFLTAVGLRALSPHVSLPLGISFFSFQAMGYLIDVYAGRIKAEKSLTDYATFLLLFPQLIAGPIVNFVEIKEQLKVRTLSADDLETGMMLFIKGLAGKVLLANQLGILWARAGGAGFATLSSPAAWLCIAAFGLQIYFDFAGYSLMAIGMGRMLGFRFPANFDHPYATTSITMFWRHWHMTLSRWFRNYVYIPLGGNRRGTARGIFNMLVVWLLTGLWHGASWNFVLWGLYYFIFLTLERTVLKRWIGRRTFSRYLYTLLVVLLGWVLFAFEDLAMGLAYLERMFSLRMGPDVLYYLRNDFVLLLVSVLACIPPVVRRVTAALSHNAAVRCAAYGGLLILSVACLLGDSYNPFLYFRF